MAIDATAETFDKDVQGSMTVVDFWAPWCGPCKMVSPIVDEVANEVEGKAKVGKVNVDESQALAERYGVMSIPTFIVFKNGVAVNQHIGELSKDGLIRLIEL